MIMKDMIFGIGKNPDSEEADFDGPPFWVYISDKKTWDETKFSNDHVDEEVIEILCQNGFAPTMETVFEPVRYPDSSKDELRKMLEDLDFVYDEKFESFMDSSF